MRRGHLGIGGWRNENTRHFRPRSGGTSHFRPPRAYGLLEAPRFPPPGVRPPRARSPAPFNNHSAPLIGNNTSDHYGRMKYRVDNRPNAQRPSERGHHHAQRPFFPLQRMRINEQTNYTNQFQNNFSEDIDTEPCLVNSMGDIDHRQLITPKDQESYNQSQYHHLISPWANIKDKRSYYDDRNQSSNSYRHENVEVNKLPVLDYIGHRPPASDHYGGNPGSVVDNSNSFSRSVDDTVDIVRKRLLNRSDSHQHSDDQNVDQHESQGDNDQKSSDYQNTHNLQTKKRTQRQRISNIKTNCDKIKNNIVHQLFKMDKDKIHKLMDNPNSSTKFEYAISSLITESQNSLNRHLRSVAEKSLTTSSDFIHNDNNTIYEDTFMKQMQCILDPQDTVFLEDIKPLVMAELSKVLQVDDYYDQQYDAPECTGKYYYRRGDSQILEPDSNASYQYDNYINESYFEGHNSPDNYGTIQHSQIPSNTYDDFQADPNDFNDRSFFERRQSRVSRDQDKERRISSEKRRLSRMSVDKSSEPRFATSDETSSRRSIDENPNKEPTNPEPSIPLFDTNSELLSDDEDPFAGLDQQYHVAVDPNFIQTCDSSPQPSFSNSESKSPTIKKEEPTNSQIIQRTPPENHSKDIRNEIEEQLKNIAKSPLKLPMIEQKSTTTPIQIKEEINTHIKQPDTHDIVLENSDTKQDQNPQHKEATKPVAGSENHSSTIKSSTSDGRKRSQDQRPSHRKEKRKKSDPSQSDSNQQILNKNIIINVNDCATKKLDKCTEAAKSIFNLYFSKDEHSKELSKEPSKTESVEKSYSDKYVKRKEQPVSSKVKPSETKKKHRTSSSSSHSMLSPKDNVNKNSSSCPTPKSDQTKTKLKDINIFMEQPRKMTSVHQPHRNTVPIKTPEKAAGESQTKIHTNLKIVKPIYIKRLQTKDTQTQFSECKKLITKFTQTNKKKLSSKFIQTDAVVFAKSESKATEPFERMKEIDLEIQVLLQEKFKLYSSLESRNPCPNSMQTLGMTVLNVSQYDEDVPESSSVDMTEDSIVADFTNIPVEELEQIALESVETLKIETAEPRKPGKNQRLQKASAMDRVSSVTPVSKAKKAKTPNISLLEQIITDDRPIEDIISLDDLESSPVTKSRRKPPSKSKPKKKKNKAVKAPKVVSNRDYKLKQCYVLINRNEFDDYLKNKAKVKPVHDDDVVLVENVMEPIVIDSEVNIEGKTDENIESKPDDNVEFKPEVNVESQQIVVEETVVNDIHFDMLDVSEDIVIGDVCEVKSSGDKDVMERIEVPVCEEIILDNSQSSMEDGSTAETGLVDNQCKMYDYSTDENLRRDTVTVTGNADAVLAIECVENNFLAACLDGNVYYFSGDGQLMTTLRGSNLAVTCLTIVQEKYGTTVYTGSLDSRIRYYDLETGMEKGPECNVLSPIQTMDRAWDTVFVGTRTGFVLQFECKNNMLIPVSTVKFSEQSILALRALKEGPRKVLLVAARSEDVTIKDAQTGLLLRTLVGPKMTVYTLLYEDGKVYCGTSSHQIHVFDYASGSHNGVHEGGKGAVCLRATGGLLFAGCYDGCVYVYREGEPRPLAQLRGPSVMLLSLAVVGSKIIAGYKDRGLYIWKIPLSILQEMIL